MPLPPGTETTLNPSEVEFRSPSSLGVRKVRVWTGGTTPRISAVYLRLDEGEITEHALSLFLDEIVLYVNTALELTRSETRVSLAQRKIRGMSRDPKAPADLTLWTQVVQKEQRHDPEDRQGSV
jgi:hypothetical protein